ncbi:MAG TPA: SCP2 sterol-binding domain-containing protein [Actinomycetota bacterium]|jgi:putative sterol carrier protein|nr:SCP2 sterol-binding domain-containing protein [Actinomycetota bacterium]
MALFPSDDWLAEFRTLINGSDEYRQASSDWEGDISFVMEAEPDRGVPDDLVARLDLWHGACRDARMISEAEAGETPYAIRAPYSRWREVLDGDLDPVKGMVQGKLKLRGDLAEIVRHVRAAQELVRLTTLVPTEYLGES